MKSADEHNLMREALMDGIIRAVSKNGLEGLTTKEIAKEANCNEAYIYRYFMDRDDLLYKAFTSVDIGFFEELKKNLYVFSNKEKSLKENGYEYFSAIWEFVTNNPDKCKFYVRYYNSTFLAGEIKEEHKKRCNEYFSNFSSQLTKNSENDILRHCVFTLFISIAMDAAMGKIEVNEESKNSIYECLFNLMINYIK